MAMASAPQLRSVDSAEAGENVNVERVESRPPRTVDADFAALRVDVDNEDDQPPALPLDPDALSASKVSPTSNGRTPKGSEKPYVPTGTNVFIAGIPSGWDEKRLLELCLPFGEIHSIKLVLNRHYAFVMYKESRSAEAAIRSLHCARTGPNGGLLHVALAMHDEGAEEAPGDRLFVRGLPPWMNRDELRNMFSVFGPLNECTILYTSDGQCKGVAFVQYATVEQATAAKDATNGKKLEQWNFPLDVRYSETSEVRAVRQQRNRDRMLRSHQTTTPRVAPPHGVGLLPPPPQTLVFPQPPPGPPPPFAQTGVEYVMTPTHHHPIPSHVNLPSPAHHLASPGPAPRHLLPVPSTMMLGLQPPPQTPPHMLGGPLGPQVLVAMPPPPAQFPSTGDILMHGAPLSADIAAQLVARFGLVEQMAAVPNNGGFFIRMKDRVVHPQLAQMLTGVLFSTGHVLQVALIQM